MAQDPYCIAGTEHVWIRPDANSPYIQTCCDIHPPEEFRQVLPSLGRLEQALQDPTWVKKHEILQTGPIADACAQCEVKEKRNISTSNRLDLYDRYNRAGQKKFLQIDFSNKCNLKCIMCSSDRSTAWAKDEERMYKMLGMDWYKPSVYNKLSTDWWIDISEDWWAGVGSVMITGGEPLYDEQALAFIQFISENFPNIEVTIITNATLVDSNILAMLSRISNVTTLCSVDGWENDVYQYSRGGHITLDTVKNNILDLTEVARVHITDALHVLTYDQEQVARDWIQRTNKYIGYGNHIVTRPDELDPRKVLSPEFFPEQNNVNIDMQREFKRWITAFDAVRGTSIYDVRPEFKEWLDRIEI